MRGGAFATVDSVSTLVRRGISPKYSDDGLLVLNQKCVRDGRVSLSLARRHDVSGRGVKDELLLKQHDVVINSTGVGTLGRVAQLRQAPSEPMTVDSHVTIVRPDLEKVDGPYFGYSLLNEQSKIEAMGAGATGQTELSRHRVADEISLWLPPRGEQRCIGGLLASIDDLIENNRRRVELLEEMAQAIYREWFVHFRYPGHEGVPLVDSPLGPIPEGWSVATLADVGTVTVGGDWGRDAPGEGEWTRVACLRGVDLPRLRRGESSGVRTRWIKNKSLEQRRVDPRDVVVEGSGECGRSLAVSDRLAGLVGLPIVYSNFCKRLRCRNPATARFAGRLLNSMVADGTMGAFKTGTTIPNLNFKALVAHPIVLPPPALLAQFEKATQPMDDFALTGEAERLTELRDLLLPKLVTGQIDMSSLDLDALVEQAVT